MPGLNLVEELTWIAEESMLFASDDPGVSPFNAAISAGAPRLAVVVGDNASGKSLLVRMLAMRARGHEVLPVSVSIRERTGAGLGEMSRMAQAMMYGDESEQSTGATSVQVVQAALERNADRPGGSIVILDEPEMGLAEGYAHALGTYIASQSKTITRRCAGVVVVTHSRPLVQGIRDTLSRKPTFVATAAGAGVQADLDGWLAREDRYSVEDLLALPEVNLERWRHLSKRLRQ